MRELLLPVKTNSIKTEVSPMTAMEDNNGGATSSSPSEPLELAMISLESRVWEPRAVEDWLDAHPEFVHDYFSRKASRSLVDAWLITNAFSGGAASTSTAHLLHGKDGDGNNSGE